MADVPIHNISDTARWVAYYRALETERPDAIFRDPFARQLAGPEGEAIVAAMPHGRSIAPALIVRTADLDAIITAHVRAGADLVLNLAAGLDTRPWRLDLPPALQWIDVDLPGILNYKTDRLRNETPACHYEAITADLTDSEEREAVFRQAGERGRRILVLTEGLVIYLTPEQVGDLAAALHRIPTAAAWALDLVSPRLLRVMTGSRRNPIGNALRNAPFRFAPVEGSAFFAPFGWHESEFWSAQASAARLHRDMRGMWFWRLMMRLAPARARGEFSRMSGVLVLTRR